MGKKTITEMVNEAAGLAKIVVGQAPPDLPSKCFMEIFKNIFFTLKQDNALLTDSGLPHVVVQGGQITSGRRQVVDKGMGVLLAAAEKSNIDWNLHDLSIEVVSKV